MNLSSTPTMSSLQIAEITGKPHGNILQDIRRILAEAEIDQQDFLSVYKAGNGQERPCYNLPRRECDLVISGYSVKYRLAIIDRWQELEKAQAFRIPASLPEALRLAADQAERIETQDTVIRIQDEALRDAAPKVDFYDTVKACDTVCQVAVAAQVAALPFGRNTLFQKLRDDGLFIAGGPRHKLLLRNCF